MSTADKINLAIAVAAGVSVLVTLLYTIATFRILKANKAVVDAMREESLAQIRPYVQFTVFIRTGTQLLYLLIKNTGRTPAWKLRLTIERDFFPFGEKRPDQNLSSLAAFSGPIECFSPGAELQFLLGSGPTLFANNADANVAPLQFDITAAYGFEGSSVTERTTVDLRPYMNSAVPHDPIVEELERMRNVLTEIQRSLRRDG